MSSLANSNYPSITAILPCYNHSRFLEARIESVLNQTFPVDEIIFLDDASTDDSVQIAKKLFKKTGTKVTYLLNTTNSGSPFAQWNAGIELAKNNIIWIAETDDSCDNRFLEKVYSKMLGSNSVLSFSQSLRIDQFGNTTESELVRCNSFWPDKFTESFVMVGIDFSQNFLSYRNAIPNASAVLFKKDAYLTAGSANASMRYAGDWDMWLRLTRQGKISFVSEELNHFRFHDGTTRFTPIKTQARAESMSIILKAHINTSDLRGNRLGLFNTIKLLKQETSFDFLSSVGPIMLIESKEVRKRYKKMSAVPEVSLVLWYFLVVLGTLARLIIKINSKLGDS